MAHDMGCRFNVINAGVLCSFCELMMVGHPLLYP